MSSGRVMGFASQPMYGGGFTHHTPTLTRLMAFLITIGWTSTPTRRSLV